MKNTIVISAYPACGKSYFYKHMKDKYSVLDSDSSKFSWIMRKRTQEEIDEEVLQWEAAAGKKSTNSFIAIIKDEEIKVRNEAFPANYIEHIKENLDKVDIIFVSSHLAVRQAMTDAGIPFFTVYPREDMLNEWVGRMYRRGNDWQFIQFQIENWDKFTDELTLEKEPHGIDVFLLGNNQYISENIITAIKMNYEDQIAEEIERLFS